MGIDAINFYTLTFSKLKIVVLTLIKSLLVVRANWLVFCVCVCAVSWHRRMKNNVTIE